MAPRDIEKIAVSSSDRLVGASTAYGYQTSAWLGRLRLHMFHREDPGEAFHDHPWDFWTFPLVSYVELVLDPATGKTSRHVVPAFRISFRPAEHAHRVLGPWAGELERVAPGRVITLCWRGRHRRAWRYLNLTDAGRVRGLPWRRYLERADPQNAKKD